MTLEAAIDTWIETSDEREAILVLAEADDIMSGDFPSMEQCKVLDGFANVLSTLVGGLFVVVCNRLWDNY